MDVSKSEDEVGRPAYVHGSILQCERRQYAAVGAGCDERTEELSHHLKVSLFCQSLVGRLLVSYVKQICSFSVKESSSPASCIGCIQLDFPDDS